MSTNQAFTLGYVLSLIGGLIVLVVSILNLVWFGTGASFLGGYGGYMRGMMDGYHNFMGNYASSTGFFAGVSVVSLICGIILGGCRCHAMGSTASTHNLGSGHHRVFSHKLRGYGRILHRRNPWHHRWSNRLKLQT